MNTRTLFVLSTLLLIGCPKEDPDDTDGGDDTETGDDTNADDTSADDTDTSCDSVEHLVFTTEVRDPDGPCSPCTEGTDLTLVGVVENPCTVAITYQTLSTCLVTSFDWTNTGTSVTDSPSWGCGDAITDWVIPVNGRTTYTHAYGAVLAGSYDLTAHFDDTAQTTATSSVVVQ